MHKGKYVAYFRVSTTKQGLSGLGLEAQQTAVSAYLDGGQWEVVAQVTEVESGTKGEQPKLKDALALCRVHGATLIIAKLDRLARNVAFISNLLESGVDFTAVDFPQANRLTIHILAAVAEHEASMISDRTKAALGAAKARGIRLGNPTSKIADMAAEGAAASSIVRKARATRRAIDLRPIIEDLQGRGHTSLRQIAQALNARGILTSRGKEWSAGQVQRLFVRLHDSE